MINKSKLTLNFDNNKLIKQNDSSTVLVQYDKNSTELEIHLTKDSKPLDISLLTVVLNFKRPDNIVIQSFPKKIDTPNGIISIIIPETALTHYGDMYLQAEVYQGNSILTSTNEIKYKITRKFVVDESDIPKDEMPILQDILNKLDNLQPAVVEGKLDKGGYIGTAQNLKDEINSNNLNISKKASIESVDNLKSRVDTLEATSPDTSNFATKEELSLKADKSNTYNKSESDTKFATKESINVIQSNLKLKADKTELTSKADESRVVLLENKVNTKADASNVFGKVEITNMLALKANKATTYTKSEIDKKLDDLSTGGTVDLSNYYTKTETDAKYSTKLYVIDEVKKLNTSISSKANADAVYNKSEIDSKLSSKANSTEVYNKQSIDSMIALKANTTEVYTKLELNNKFTDYYDKTEIAIRFATKEELNSKASLASLNELSNKINTKANISDVYNKSETDTLLSSKVNKDTIYDKTVIDNKLALKADKTTTYTKTEVDDKLSKITVDSSSNKISNGTTKLSIEKPNADIIANKNFIMQPFQDTEETEVYISSKTYHGTSGNYSTSITLKKNEGDAYFGKLVDIVNKYNFKAGNKLQIIDTSTNEVVFSVSYIPSENPETETVEIYDSGKSISIFTKQTTLEEYNKLTQSTKGKYRLKFIDKDVNKHVEIINDRNLTTKLYVDNLVKKSIPDFTELATKTELALKADKSNTYNKIEIDNKLNLKADSTVVSNIAEILVEKADKTAINELKSSINLKQDNLPNNIEPNKLLQSNRGELSWVDMPASTDLTNYYNKTESNELFATKAELQTKASSESLESLTSVVNTKASKSEVSSLKSEVDTKIDNTKLSSELSKVQGALESQINTKQDSLPVNSKPNQILQNNNGSLSWIDTPTGGGSSGGSGVRYATRTLFRGGSLLKWQPSQSQGGSGIPSLENLPSDIRKRWNEGFEGCIMKVGFGSYEHVTTRLLKGLDLSNLQIGTGFEPNNILNIPQLVITLSPNTKYLYGDSNNNQEDNYLESYRFICERTDAIRDNDSIGYIEAYKKYVNGNQGLTYKAKYPAVDVLYGSPHMKAQIFPYEVKAEYYFYFEEGKDPILFIYFTNDKSANQYNNFLPPKLEHIEISLPIK